MIRIQACILFKVAENFYIEKVEYRNLCIRPWNNVCLAERRRDPMGQGKGGGITAWAVIASEERRWITGSKVDHLHPHK